MPSVEVNGTRINYVRIDCEAGENGQDLVMIHGLATSLAFWYFPLASHFSKSFRVLLYDLRGHGRSGTTVSGYTPQNMGVDLSQLLDRLEIGRAHFLAHSFGGAVALSLACAAPHRLASLVLADTHLSAVRRLSGAEEWELGKKIEPVLRRYGLDVDPADPYFGYKLFGAVARMQRKQPAVPSDLDDLLSPIIGNFPKRTAKQWLHLMENSRAENELMGDDGLSLESLRKLGFPIFALYGEHSQTLPTGKKLLNVWPQAEFRLIRDSGHFFPLKRSDEFADSCLEFWSRYPIYKRVRRNEPASANHFRRNRFYTRKNAWFFDTREATEQGPFPNLELARASFREKLRVSSS